MTKEEASSVTTNEEGSSAMTKQEACSARKPDAVVVAVVNAVAAVTVGCGGDGGGYATAKRGCSIVACG
ncbi:hypothetical protein AHAS_Ahas15G0143700 [Arachis hypogaea]